MKKMLILMLLGVLFVPMNGSAKADEVLYCQSELATGFAEKNGSWTETTFKLKRFTIKVIGDFEKVVGLFSKKPTSCHFPYEKTFFNGKTIDLNSGKEIICQQRSGSSFIFNKTTKRFLIASISHITYLEENTPVLYAGTCEKF